MKRVLVSQNEQNNGTDYLIVDGKLLNDEDKIVYYGREFSKTDDWKEIHKEDFLEIRKNKNQLLIKSFYNEKDSIGSVIYYMYLIDETVNIQTIIDYLEKDSQLIKRTFDKRRTQEIISEIKKNKEIKKQIEKYGLITVGILALIYLITRI